MIKRKKCDLLHITHYAGKPLLLLRVIEKNRSYCPGHISITRRYIKFGY